MKIDIRSIDVDELTLAHLAELYETCYWCYAQDRHRTEAFKQEDIQSYIKTLDSLYDVMEYLGGDHRAASVTRKISERIDAKKLIAEKMGK